MDLRELVILILGLTIVGVVVRGLLVALKARKNQLRLAIDKNIPKDIDLDALELAELPSGGARIVRRSVNDASITPPESREDAAVSDESSQQSSTVSDDSADLLIDSNATEQTSSKHEDEEVASEVKSAGEGLVESDLNADADADSEPGAQESISDGLAPAVPGSISLGDGIDDIDDFNEPDQLEPPEQKVALSKEVEIGEDLQETGEQESDEYSSITLSAGDRIGGENRRVKTTARKEFRGTTLFGSLSAAGKSLSALVSARKSSEDDLSSNSSIQPATEEASLADDPTMAPDVESSALFEEYSQVENTSEASSARAKEPSESHSPAVTDLFPETFEDLTTTSQSFGEADEAPIQVEKIATVVPAEQAKTPNKKANEQASKNAAEQAPRKSQKKTKTKEQENTGRADNAAGVNNGELASNTTEEDKKPKPAVKPQQSSMSDVTEVLVLNVTAKKGRLIMGERLLSLMEGLDLQFDERKIFSRRSSETEDDALFSVANMLQPGTFDLSNMENFATVGVTLFLPLPAPASSFEAFEEMLQTAQDLVRSIDGELRDDQRNMMTGQTIEHYRQRVRDFELRRLRSRAVAE